MGQKVNPHGLRVGVIKNWDSRWYSKDETFGDTLVSDYKLRTYLKKSLFSAGIPKIEIERDNERVRVFIHCAKPGMVIGRGGTEIEKLKATIEKMVGKPASVNVVEVKQPDLSAQLVAESVANQLERRIAFRRAMKQAIGRAMRMGAKGIKISVSGRLGGAEIARSEHYHEGTIPLQTLRADIDYGMWEANTTYGKIGVKVWIFKGEVLPDVKKKFTTMKPELSAPRQERRQGDRRDGQRRDNRHGGGGRPFNNQNRGFGGGRPQGGNRPQGGGRPQGDRPYGDRRPNNTNKEGGNK